MMFSLVAKIT